MKRKPIDWSVLVIFLIIAGFIALLVGLALFQPYMEARAYERVTGKHVSMWDAMWLDLRVQETTK